MTVDSMERMKQRLAAARGDRPVDLLIKGGTLLNVLSGRMEEADVAVFDSVVVGFGSYEAKTVIDASGKVVCPSFLDGHLHLESSMLTPVEFARVVIPSGTGAVIVDPHEIANVLGMEGIRFVLDASEGLPLDIYCMLPSCVPATPLETSGAALGADDLLELKDHPRVLGLAEVMNFPGAVHGDEEVLKKVLAFSDGPLDGHAPLLSGRDLNAYITAGIGSDHECTRLDEAREKLSRGMRVMIRQGTQARNLRDLLPLVTPYNARRTMLVTDDRSPEELIARGHMNDVLAIAVEQGLDPIPAVQMATLNTAEYFGLRGRGAVAPGFQADIAVLEDVKSFRVNTVMKKGEVVWREGAFVNELPPFGQGLSFTAMNVAPLSETSFRIPAKSGRARVIGLIPGQIITGKEIMDVTVKDGLVEADPGRDLLKIAVVERHKGTGNVSMGLVTGFGLKEGALCSSVAHDSHNIIVLGANDADMLAAVRRVRDMGGGQAVVSRGEVLAEIPLPIAGLVSDRPAGEVASARKELVRAAKKCGCAVDDPFMAMSFLALPVIPSLKITDRGLVDVDRFEFVPLSVE